MHNTLMPTLATRTQKSCECISRWQIDRVGWLYNQQGQSLFLLYVYDYCMPHTIDSLHKIVVVCVCASAKL